MNFWLSCSKPTDISIEAAPPAAATACSGKDGDAITKHAGHTADCVGEKGVFDLPHNAGSAVYVAV